MRGVFRAVENKRTEKNDIGKRAAGDRGAAGCTKHVVPVHHHVHDRSRKQPRTGIVRFLQRDAMADALPKISEEVSQEEPERTLIEEVSQEEPERTLPPEGSEKKEATLPSSLPPSIEENGAHESQTSANGFSPGAHDSSAAAAAEDFSPAHSPTFSPAGEPPSSPSHFTTRRQTSWESAEEDFASKARRTRSLDSDGGDNPFKAALPPRMKAPEVRLDPRAGDILRAIEAKHLTLFSRLITKEKVDPNTILTSDGETAAHVCVRFCGEDEGYEPLLRLALRLGCDPNTRAIDGSTPSHRAAESDSASIFGLLKSFGGGVDLEDAAGFAPAHVCAALGKAKALEWLLTEGGVPVDRPHENGMSLAMFAARYGHLETLKCLKVHGADLRETCLIEHELVRAVRVSASIMSVACYEGQDNIIEFLEKECGIGPWESSLMVTDVPIFSKSDENIAPDDVDAYTYHGWPPEEAIGPFPFGPMRPGDLDIALEDLPRSQFEDYDDFYAHRDDDDEEPSGDVFAPQIDKRTEITLETLDDEEEDGYPEAKSDDGQPGNSLDDGEERPLSPIGGEPPLSPPPRPQRPAPPQRTTDAQNIVLPPLVDTDYFAATLVNDDDDLGGGGDLSDFDENHFDELGNNHRLVVVDQDDDDDLETLPGGPTTTTTTTGTLQYPPPPLEEKKEEEEKVRTTTV